MSPSEADVRGHSRPPGPSECVLIFTSYGMGRYRAYKLVQYCETSNPPERVPPLWIVDASRVAALDVTAPAECGVAISLCVLHVADPMRTTQVAASTAAWKKTASRIRSGLRGELLRMAPAQPECLPGCV